MIYFWSRGTGLDNIVNAGNVSHYFLDTFDKKI